MAILASAAVDTADECAATANLLSSLLQEEENSTAECYGESTASLSTSTPALNVFVRSEGYEFLGKTANDAATILVNGVPIVGAFGGRPSARGYNVAYLNPRESTMAVVSKSFDTYSCCVEELRDFLYAIPSGRLVLVAIQDEARHQFEELNEKADYVHNRVVYEGGKRAKDAAEAVDAFFVSLGATTTDVGFRGSFALAGFTQGSEATATSKLEGGFKWSKRGGPAAEVSLYIPIPDDVVVDDVNENVMTQASVSIEPSCNSASETSLGIAHEGCFMSYGWDASRTAFACASENDCRLKLPAEQRVATCGCTCKTHGFDYFALEDTTACFCARGYPTSARAGGCSNGHGGGMRMDVYTFRETSTNIIKVQQMNLQLQPNMLTFSNAGCASVLRVFPSRLTANPTTLDVVEATTTVPSTTPTDKGTDVEGCLVKEDGTYVWIVHSDKTRNWIGSPTSACKSKAAVVPDIEVYPKRYNGAAGYTLDAAQSAAACAKTACSTNDNGGIDGVPAGDGGGGGVGGGLFVLLTSSTCEDAGLMSITNPETCAAAATALGIAASGTYASRTWPWLYNTETLTPGCSPWANHNDANSQALDFNANMASSVACGATLLHSAGPYTMNCVCIKLETNRAGTITELSRGKVFAEGLVMLADYTLQFQIKPTSTRKGWASIVHYTTGTDGSRVPGIWFFPGTTKLHVVVGPNNHNLNPDHLLPLNQWSTVSIYVTGSTARIVVNTLQFSYSGLPARPATTIGVTLYHGLPSYEPAAASIQSLSFSDGTIDPTTIAALITAAPTGGTDISVATGSSSALRCSELDGDVFLTLDQQFCAPVLANINAAAAAAAAAAAEDGALTAPSTTMGTTSATTAATSPAVLVATNNASGALDLGGSNRSRAGGTAAGVVLGLLCVGGIGFAVWHRKQQQQNTPVRQRVNRKAAKQELEMQEDQRNTVMMEDNPLRLSRVQRPAPADYVNVNVVLQAQGQHDQQYQNFSIDVRSGESGSGSGVGGSGSGGAAEYAVPNDAMLPSDAVYSGDGGGGAMYAVPKDTDAVYETPDGGVMYASSA